MTMSPKSVFLILCLHFCQLQQVLLTTVSDDEEQDSTPESPRSLDHPVSPQVNNLVQFDPAQAKLPMTPIENLQALMNARARIDEKIIFFASKTTTELTCTKDQFIQEIISIVNFQQLNNVSRKVNHKIREKTDVLFNGVKHSILYEVNTGYDSIQDYCDKTKEAGNKFIEEILDEVAMRDTKWESGTKNIEKTIQTTAPDKSNVNQVVETIVNPIKPLIDSRKEFVRHRLIGFQDIVITNEIALFKRVSQFRNVLISDGQANQLLISTVENVKHNIFELFNSFIDKMKCGYEKGKEPKEEILKAAVKGLKETFNRLLEDETIDKSVEEGKENIRLLISDTKDEFNNIVSQLRFDLSENLEEFKYELREAYNTLENTIPKNEIDSLKNEINEKLLELTPEHDVETLSYFIEKKIDDINYTYNMNLHKMLANVKEKFTRTMKNETTLVTAARNKLEALVKNSIKDGLKIVYDIMTAIDSKYEMILSKHEELVNSLYFTVENSVDNYVQNKETLLDKHNSYQYWKD